MSRLTTFLFALTLLTGIQNAQASVIADLRGDFVLGASVGDPGILPATGTGTWSYLASNTVNPTLDVTLDVQDWNGSSYVFLTGSGAGDYVDLLNLTLTADEVRVHPSFVSPTYSVVRWIAGPGEAGLVDVSGNVRKVDAGGGGGVTFDLFVDGISLVSGTLAFNDTVGFAFDEMVTVAVGSTVDLVIGPNGDDAFDSTALRATITQVPEPATAALLALGLVGLGFSRRHAVR